MEEIELIVRSSEQVGALSTSVMVAHERERERREERDLASFNKTTRICAFDKRR